MKLVEKITKINNILPYLIYPTPFVFDNINSIKWNNIDDNPIYLESFIDKKNLIRILNYLYSNIYSEIKEKEINELEKKLISNFLRRLKKKEKTKTSKKYNISQIIKFKEELNKVQSNYSIIVPFSIELFENYLKNSEIINKKLVFKLKEYFNNHEISYLITTNPSIIKSSPYSIEKRINFLDYLGASKKDLNNLIVIDPNYFSFPIYKIKETISFLENYFSRGTIKKLFVFSKVYRYTPYSLNRKIRFFENRGYINEDIDYLFEKTPYLINLSVENLKKKFEFYKSIGLTNDEIIDITLRSPITLLRNINVLKNNYQIFLKIGLSSKEIKSVVLEFPNIIVFNSKKLEEKINYLKNLGLTDGEIKEFIINYPGTFTLSSKTKLKKIFV
jgi:predicted lactoylglutathione lyase